MPCQRMSPARRDAPINGPSSCGFMPSNAIVSAVVGGFLSSALPYTLPSLIKLAGVGAVVASSL